jgi:hypothetical protein
MPATREVNLKAIIRNAWLLSLALTLGSLFFRSRPVTAGIALGCVLAILNFLWLRRSVGLFVNREGGALSRAGVVLYFMKYVITGGVIFLSMKYAIINVYALMVGLLVVVAVITIEGIRQTSSLSEEAARDDS